VVQALPHRKSKWLNPNTTFGVSFPKRSKQREPGGIDSRLVYYRTTLANKNCLLQFLARHKSLRITPAMEAAIAGHVWSLKELLAGE